MEGYLKRAQHEGKTESHEGKTDNRSGTYGVINFPRNDRASFDPLYVFVTASPS
jgi:hypothetical protein